jgi:hypothetical protein
MIITNVARILKSARLAAASDISWIRSHNSQAWAGTGLLTPRQEVRSLPDSRATSSIG